jgi:hypothetical protein
VKLLEVLAAFLALVLDSINASKRRKRQEENREVLANPDPELERRGWLQSDADNADVPNAGQDRDS